MADHRSGGSLPPPPNREFSDEMNNFGESLMQKIAGLIKSTAEQSRIEVEALINEKMNKNGAETSDHDEENSEKRTPTGKPKVATFQDFKKCGAKECDGDIDPIKAYEWIKVIERAFRASHCREKDQVTYATNMLTSTALDWWEDVYESMDATKRQSLTWNEFKERFIRFYCPDDIQYQYEKDFLELKQGNMIVSDYLKEFNRKVKFAPDYVNSTPKKIKKFIEGLQIEIREHLDGRKFLTMDETAEQARRREHILEQKRAELMPPSKKHHSDFQNQPFRSIITRNPSSKGLCKSRSDLASSAQYCQTCGIQHFGPCYNPRQTNSGLAVTCHHCGKVGHISPNCPKKLSPSYICYGCGASGHTRKYCPQSQNSQNTVSGVKPAFLVTPPKKKGISRD